MRRFLGLALIALFSLLSTESFAQIPSNSRVVAGGLVQGGNVSLAVTSASARVALTPGNSALVYNAGAQPVFVRLGDITVAAALTDTPIAPNSALTLDIGTNTNIAGISAVGTSTLLVSTGNGNPNYSVTPANETTVYKFVQAQTVTAGSAYASGNAVGGLITITNAARIGGGTGYVASVAVDIKSTQTGAIDVFFFDANPSGSTCTDKSNISIVVADFNKVLGYLQIPTASMLSVGTPTVGVVANVKLPFSLVAPGTSLYACVVTRATPTFTATTDVSLDINLVRN